MKSPCQSHNKSVKVNRLMSPSPLRLFSKPLLVFEKPDLVFDRSPHAIKLLFLWKLPSMRDSVIQNQPRLFSRDALNLLASHPHFCNLLSRRLCRGVYYDFSIFFPQVSVDFLEHIPIKDVVLQIEVNATLRDSQMPS